MANMKEEVHQWHHQRQQEKKEEGKEWRGGEGVEGEGEEEEARLGRREHDGVSMVVEHTTTAMGNGTVHQNPQTPSAAAAATAGEEKTEGKGSTSSVPPRRVFIPRSILASEVGPHCRDFFLFGGGSRRSIAHPWSSTIHPRASPSLSSSSFSSSAMVREERQKEQPQLYLHEKVRELALSMYVHAARCRYQALEPRFSDRAVACVGPPPVLGVEKSQDDLWTRFFHPTKEQAREVWGQLQERLQNAKEKEEEEGLCNTFASSVSAWTARPNPTHRRHVVEHDDPVTSKKADGNTPPFDTEAELLIIGDATGDWRGTSTGRKEGAREAEDVVFPASSVRIPFPLPPFLDTSYSEGLKEGASADYAKIASMGTEGSFEAESEHNREDTAAVVRSSTERPAAARAASSASSSTAMWMHRALSGKKGGVPAKETVGHALEDPTRGETPCVSTSLEDDAASSSSSSSMDVLIEKEFTAELRQSRGREIAASSPSSSSSSENDSTEMEQYLKMRRSVERESPESLLSAYQRHSPPMKERTFTRPSFRLRLPRGNPSGMVDYGRTREEGREKSGSSSSSSLTPKSGSSSSASHPSSAAVFEAPRTPRKVARPKRSSPPSEPEEKK